MMNLFKKLSAGIIGTTCMTLYSYIVSVKKNEEFEEPVLLHELLNRSKLADLWKSNMRKTYVDGWLLHYAAGMVFSTVYDQIWKRTKTAPTIPAGIVMGAVSGLAGVAIWDVNFRVHPNPPRIDYKEYYKHLMAAHIIFGIFAALGYRMPDEEENIEVG